MTKHVAAGLESGESAHFKICTIRRETVVPPKTFANMEKVRPGTGREAGLGQVRVRAYRDVFTACLGRNYRLPVNPNWILKVHYHPVAATRVPPPETRH